MTLRNCFFPGDSRKRKGRKTACYVDARRISATKNIYFVLFECMVPLVSPPPPFPILLTWSSSSPVCVENQGFEGGSVHWYNIPPSFFSTTLLWMAGSPFSSCHTKIGVLVLLKQASKQSTVKTIMDSDSLSLPRGVLSYAHISQMADWIFPPHIS